MKNIVLITIATYASTVSANQCEAVCVRTMERHPEIVLSTKNVKVLVSDGQDARVEVLKECQKQHGNKIFDRVETSIAQEGYGHLKLDAVENFSVEKNCSQNADRETFNSEPAPQATTATKDN
jgi:hypothetical protein